MRRAKATDPNKKFALVVVKVPTAMADGLDHLAQLNDSDRSKEIRKAIRERIMRQIPDSRMSAAHA